MMITEAEPLDAPGPRIVFLSDAFERLTGYSREEAIGRDPRFLQGQGTDPRARARFRDALKRGVPARIELLNYRKDGTPFFVEVDVAPLRDAQGRLTHFAGTLRDTTERRRLLDSLYEAKDTLERLVGASPLATLAVDEEWRVTLWNAASEALFGWTREEAIGRPLPHIPPDGRAASDALHARIRAGETVTGLEIVRERKNGVRVEVGVSAGPLYDAQGRWRGALAIYEDISERKRTERQVRESRERFRLIFERAGIGMALCDGHAHPVEVNPALQRMLGYGDEELRALSLTEITHAADVGDEEARFRAVIRGELETYSLTTRLLHRAGHVVWVRGHVTRVTGAPGNGPLALAMIEDVTERKIAEETQARLTAILEATPDIVVSTDTEGRVHYVNEAGRRLLGIEGDVTRFSFTDFLSRREGGTMLREGVPAALHDGVWRGECAIVDRDGRELPVSQVLVAHREQDGSVASLSTILRDISERRANEDTLRFLSEASRVLAGSLDLDDIVRSFARQMVPRCADWCVVDMVEDGGARRAALVHADEEGQRALDALAAFPPSDDRPIGPSQVLRSGEPELVTEVSAAWLRGVSRSDDDYEAWQRLDPRSVMIVPLCVRGRVVGAATFGSARAQRRYGDEELQLAADLAGRAALAIDNARLYREAREATRMRDEVLRIVAHDLRGPLTNISLAATAMDEQGAVAPEDIRLIVRSTERAQRLIGDLLDVARAEAGHLKVEPAAADARRLVEDAAALFRAQAEKASLHFATEVEDALPPVLADRDRVLQVLGNLLDNARKATGRGGRVTLRAARDGDFVRLSVADTGAGIREEHLPNLFEAFWQARPKGSAGLGLAIAKGIVEAHGGRIWAESRVGEGSALHFTVPAVA